MLTAQPAERVERLHYAGETIHLAPGRHGIGFACFDFVPHAPGKNRRMTAVTHDETPDVLLLRPHRRSVVEAEAVTRMPDPQPHHHLETKCLRLVEHPGVGLTIDTDDLGAGFCKLGQRSTIALEGRPPPLHARVLSERSAGKNGQRKCSGGAAPG